MRSLPINRRRLWQLAFDAALIAAAWRLAYFLRFDKATPRYYQHLLSWRVFVVVIAVKLAVFILFGFYNRWWRYVSVRGVNALSPDAPLGPGVDPSLAARATKARCASSPRPGTSASR